MQLPWSLPGSPAQRIEERQSLSSSMFAVFQGPYAWTNRPSYLLRHHRKDSRNKPWTSLPRLNIIHGNSSAPTLRSPTSTRSLIDPSSSPGITARPLSTTPFDTLLGAPGFPVQAYTRNNGHDDIAGPPARRIVGARFRSRPRWQPRHSRGRAFLPFMEKKGMRRRVFHCIVTGSILVITLIVCK